MILYFSATGNSKYVASRIAAETNERVVSIVECCHAQEYTFALKAGEAVGIVSPTYFFGLPVILKEFLSKLQVESTEDPYVYYVATYGTFTGQSGFFANEILENKGLALSSSYSVKMPDTWTPVFDLTDSEKVQKINEKAEKEIDTIIKRIQSTEMGNYMKARLPKIISKQYHVNYEKSRLTKHFIVEDSCVGCGLCAKMCPDHAIEIRTGQPVWVKDKCVMCLGCLHRCPQFSIQYGSKTKKHGQYQHPQVKD